MSTSLNINTKELSVNGVSTPKPMTGDIAVIRPDSSAVNPTTTASECTHTNEVSFGKAARHMKLLYQLNDIYTRKNQDYGDSFHDTWVEEGFAMARIRLSDKLNRFKTLTKGLGSDRGAYSIRIDADGLTMTQKVKDESIRDTLLDLANYAIMTVLEMDDEAGVRE